MFIIEKPNIIYPMLFIFIVNGVLSTAINNKTNSNIEDIIDKKNKIENSNILKKARNGNFKKNRNECKHISADPRKKYIREHVNGVTETATKKIISDRFFSYKFEDYNIYGKNDLSLYNDYRDEHYDKKSNKKNDLKADESYIGQKGISNVKSKFTNCEKDMNDQIPLANSLENIKDDNKFIDRKFEIDYKNLIFNKIKELDSTGAFIEDLHTVFSRTEDFFLKNLEIPVEKLHRIDETLNLKNLKHNHDQENPNKDFNKMGYKKRKIIQFLNSNNSNKKHKHENFSSDLVEQKISYSKDQFFNVLINKTYVETEESIFDRRKNEITCHLSKIILFFYEKKSNNFIFKKKYYLLGLYFPEYTIVLDNLMINFNKIVESYSKENKNDLIPNFDPITFDSVYKKLIKFFLQELNNKKSNKIIKDLKKRKTDIFFILRLLKTDIINEIFYINEIIIELAKFIFDPYNVNCYRLMLNIWKSGKKFFSIAKYSIFFFCFLINKEDLQNHLFDQTMNKIIEEKQSNDRISDNILENINMKFFLRNKEFFKLLSTKHFLNFSRIIYRTYNCNANKIENFLKSQYGSTLTNSARYILFYPLSIKEKIDIDIQKYNKDENYMHFREKIKKNEFIIHKTRSYVFQIYNRHFLCYSQNGFLKFLYNSFFETVIEQFLQ